MKYLIFKINEISYAIKITNVIEICNKLNSYVTVFTKDKNINCLYNYRNKIIPIYNASLVDKDYVTKSDLLIIIVDDNNNQYGLIIDSVDNIIDNTTIQDNKLIDNSINQIIQLYNHNLL